MRHLSQAGWGGGAVIGWEAASRSSRRFPTTEARASSVKKSHARDQASPTTSPLHVPSHVERADSLAHQSPHYGAMACGGRGGMPLARPPAKPLLPHPPAALGEKPAPNASPLHFASPRARRFRHPPQVRLSERAWSSCAEEKGRAAAREREVVLLPPSGLLLRPAAAWLGRRVALPSPRLPVRLVAGQASDRNG